jgi:DHA1 family multidrug resistance protein-like MFS transporter
VWFEAFPLVYIDIYHFNLGTSGLPFIGLMVSCVITSIGYVAYNYYHVEPKVKRTGVFVPESRMLVALIASTFIPVSLFIFGSSGSSSYDSWALTSYPRISGWTSRADIHWIVPTIGAALYLPGCVFDFIYCDYVDLSHSTPDCSCSSRVSSCTFHNRIPTTPPPSSPGTVSSER